MYMNPLACKLSGYMELTDVENEQIDRWCSLPLHLPGKRHLIATGDRSNETCIVLEGWACRYKNMRNGRRQIVGLLLPGDVCDLHEFLVHSADHSIALIGEAKVALVSGKDIQLGLEQAPRLERAFWWASLIDKSIAWEWISNIGCREAAERIANLICELWARSDRVGLASEDSFPMPMSQLDIADALGLTSVHINRMLRELREAGLLTIAGKRAVLDLPKLRRFGGFDPGYLRLATVPA